MTWCHHEVEKGHFKKALLSLVITVFLGLVFSFLQVIEYYFCSFSISCSSFSSIYFLGTGFHGVHVIIGTLLLLVCLFRFSFLFISPNHNRGFECSVWY